MLKELRELQAKQKAVNEAEENYVNLIGKPVEHLTCTFGKLHDIKLVTTISYQFYSGGKQYHNNEHFDRALKRVIRKNFTQLSEEALLLMQADVDADHKALREELSAALDEIDNMEG